MDAAEQVILEQNQQQLETLARNCQHQSYVGGNGGGRGYKPRLGILMLPLPLCSFFNTDLVQIIWTLLTHMEESLTITLYNGTSLSVSFPFSSFYRCPCRLFSLHLCLCPVMMSSKRSRENDQLHHYQTPNKQ